MRFCKKCVMPNTRPGITFNDEGVCSPCVNYEKRKETDWNKRMDELRLLCDKHRGINGDGYDCIIAVSGGKDSHTQVDLIKNKMNMNPLLVSVDNFSWTQTGRKNIANIREAFDCDMITFSLKGKTCKKMFRKTLVEIGSPMWYADAAIYAFPYNIALKLGLKLLFYGENVNYEYGGEHNVETPSALKQFENDVVKPVDFSRWTTDGVTMQDLDSVKNPTYEELISAGLEPTYLSYFVPWSSHKNYLTAKKHGFQSLGKEWVRAGTIEDYNQVDSAGYLINQWFKYPKYGHASATEMASRWIRDGLITRKEAIKLVKKYDKYLDQYVLSDFLDFVGMSHAEFWEVADKWYNTDLFKKDQNGNWVEKWQLR